MGIFDFLKQPGRSRGHELDQEERDLGGEATATKTSLKKARAELEIERLKLEAERDQLKLRAQIEEARQELADIMSDDEDEEPQGGSSTEDALMTLLLSKVMGGQQPVAPIAAPAPAPQPAPTSFDDQQIEAVWRSIPKDQQKIAKKLSDNQLKAYITGSLPSISDESLERAVAFVRRQ